MNIYYCEFQKIDEKSIYPKSIISLIYLLSIMMYSILFNNSAHLLLKNKILLVYFWRLELELLCQIKQITKKFVCHFLLILCPFSLLNCSHFIFLSKRRDWHILKLLGIIQTKEEETNIDHPKIIDFSPRVKLTNHIIFWKKWLI